MVKYKNANEFLIDYLNRRTDEDRPLSKHLEIAFEAGRNSNLVEAQVSPKTAKELLPCPFCGNEAELIEKGNNFTKKRFVTIKCTNKNCRAEMTNGAIRNDMNWLKGISTDAWNKRAGREPQSK